MSLESLDRGSVLDYSDYSTVPIPNNPMELLLSHQLLSTNPLRLWDKGGLRSDDTKWVALRHNDK